MLKAASERTNARSKLAAPLLILAAFLTACGGGGGGGGTAPVSNNPVPSLTSLSPSSGTAGGAAFTLTVNGTNFISTSSVLWNGSPRTTTFVSGTQLSAAITAADIASTGTASVTVSNPSPGGGTSSPLTFSINTPPPTISSLVPAVTQAGHSDFTLTVNGLSFTSNSTIQWNGTALPTQHFVSSNQLTATVPAADVASTGTFPVTVADPNFPDSNSLSFTVAPVTNTLQITTQFLPPASNGGNFHFVLASAGSVGQVAWAVTNGALPSGLSLDSSTGLISGTVSGTSSNFSVQANDSANPPNVAIQDMNITIASLGRNDVIPACGGTDNATLISNGTLRASISPYGDIDTYSFTLTQTATNLNIRTYAQDLDIGNNLIVQSDFLDTVLELLDSSCNVVALNDDLSISQLSYDTDSQIIVGSSPFPTTPPANSLDTPAPTSLPPGTYYIRVRDYRGDGRPDLIYDLTVSGIQ